MMFAANAQENCGRRHGFVALDQSGRGYHCSHGIGGKVHDDETDHGITKPCHHPGKVTANKRGVARSGVLVAKRLWVLIRPRAVQTTAYDTSSRREFQSEI
jgi:hypothetical protein